MYIKGWLAAKSILKYPGVKAAEISSSSTAVSMEKLNDKSLPKAKSTSILDLSLPFALEAIFRLKVSRYNYSIADVIIARKKFEEADDRSDETLISSKSR